MNLLPDDPMNLLPPDQIERLALAAYAALQQRQPLLWPLEWACNGSNFKDTFRLVVRVAATSLLREELSKWRAECEATHRESSIAIADLQWGLEQLQQHLRKGGTVVFQDHQWWLFDSNGEGIMEAVNVLGLVQKLAQSEEAQIVIHDSILPELRRDLAERDVRIEQLIAMLITAGVPKCFVCQQYVPTVRVGQIYWCVECLQHRAVH